MRTALASLAILSGIASAQADDSLRDLLATRRCAVSALLRATYAQARALPEDQRFFIIRVQKKLDAYVRCRFADRAPKVACEASPAYYEEGNDHPLYVFLPPERIAALAKLGFAPGPAANLIYTGDKLDFDAIAGLMLTALHDGFGVRAETALDETAPLTNRIVIVCRF